MYDDLDRIESIYGSVAEYNRSMFEETYEEHLQSERIDRMEEAIKTADDTVRRWDRVTVWDENSHFYDQLLTDKEKLEIEEATKDWTLLFQLESYEGEDFDLCFGDCGRLYFWIKKEDLRNCNFDNTQLVSRFD